MSWPKGARKWSREEIVADVELARRAFRERRLAEPKARYLTAFEAIERANHELTPKLSQLFSESVDKELIANIVRDEELLAAFRYLAAPPISEDDLETLSGERLAWTQIRSDAKKAQAIRDVIVAILDPKRFPWVSKGRSPTQHEVEMAVLASTVTASAQRVQTERRSEERNELQGAVETLLGRNRFKRFEKPRAGIKNLRRDAPAPGRYMTEVVVGEHNADLVVGLRDYRVLAIECKGSNSEINSRKRINKEVARDASSWVTEFGSKNLIPAAVIQGVFSAAYIEQAQETPVVFFWGHRLKDLADLIKSAK